MGFVPSIQQEAVFNEVKTGTGSFIVEAVAGAGKTTTIVKACEFMPGTVFLGAYNAKMGKELKERIGHLPNVRAGTFHSVGYGVLRKAIFKLGNPKASKVRDLVDAFIAEKDREFDLRPLATSVVSIVSMAKQRGIGPIYSDNYDNWMDMIEHFDLTSDLPDDYEVDMAKVIKFARIILKRSVETTTLGIIDFDDMCYMPLVMKLRFFQQDWVLVDEAQDTNPVRRAMVRKMLKPGGRMIAVGDPHQAIYGFSGADNDSLSQIAVEFGCKTLPLTVTYRCPKSVVAVAREFVHHITAHESAPEGTTTSVEYENILDHAKLGDAILCRYNKYLVNLCFKFIRNGISARIEGRAIGEQLIGLVTKWKVKRLDTLAAKVIAWSQKEVRKAEAKNNDTKAQLIADRAETVLVLIDRGLEEGIETIEGLVEMIRGLFDDRVVDKKDMITLCSTHRSKGLEWNRVFILGLHELMGKKCRQEWQTEQEINLQYVAVTRSQSELFLVTGVKEESKQHKFEEA